MTTRNEEIAAVIAARNFFRELTKPSAYPRVSAAIRRRAGQLSEELEILYWNTSPQERMKRVFQDSRRFLFDLLNPKETPKATSPVRRQASRVCRHFPLLWDDRGFSDKDLKW